MTNKVLLGIALTCPLCLIASGSSDVERKNSVAKASAEYVMKELEPKDAPLAWWPPTYGRKPLDYDPRTDPIG